MGIFVSEGLRQVAVAQSRELRKIQTIAEKTLWDQLKEKKFCELKVRRQHPVFYEDNFRTSFFIADFYIYSKKLIIEVDGEIHKHRNVYDSKRDQILRNLGYNIIHIRNDEIFSDIKNVLSELRLFIESIQVREDNESD